MTRSSGGFTQEDRDVINKLLTKLTKVETKLTKVENTVTSLKGSLREANQVISDQTKTINYLCSQINVANYRSDSNNQYGRREIMRVRGITPELGNDPEKIVADIAQEIENATRLAAAGTDKVAVNINLDREKDIQRCHFLGKTTTKLVCKFQSYKQRMKFIRNKKIINSATTGKYKDVFIGEDLTPLRARLVWYIHHKFSHKFCNIHTMNGTIRMKKDANDREWISVNNPDDLFKVLDNENDFDLEFFNKGLHTFKILPQKPLSPILFEFSDTEDE